VGCRFVEADLTGDLSGLGTFDLLTHLPDDQERMIEPAPGRGVRALCRISPWPKPRSKPNHSPCC
jgi:hypothetical protein